MAAPLHVANGQATAARLGEAGVAGRVLSHDDVLCDGPFPPDLPPSKAWSHRAGWMARHHGADGAKYLFTEMALERDIARHGGDVVLWSDAGCLHCAMNLLHLLRLPTKARLLLAHAAGRRVGERTPTELAALAAAAEPVPAARVASARKACALLAAGDPAPLHAFVNGGLAAWPAMQESLRLRLRMPRLLDTAVLQHVAAGPMPFAELHRRLAADPELAGLGYGDASYRVHVKGMQEAGLVSFDGDVVVRPGHAL